MYPLKNGNKNGELITIQQTCEMTNLCANTVRKLVKESGTGVKIGKSYRVKRGEFIDYIFDKYSVQ